MFYDFHTMTGVAFAERPTDLLEPIGLGDVVAHNLITPARRRGAIDAHIAEYYWSRRMLGGFRMKPSLVRVSDARFIDAHLASGDAILLNGASGDRARNEFRSNFTDPNEASAALRAMFPRRADPEALALCDPPGGRSSAGPLIVECKNFFNFFHFTTESLHFPAALPNRALRGFDRILLSARSNEVQPFAQAWADEAYPALQGRLQFATGLASSGEPFDGPVHTVLSARHLLYQLEGPHHAAIEAARPPSRDWEGYDAHPRPVHILSLNTHDRSLADFRAQAIRLAKKTIPARWSRRIYVARSAAIMRQRIMQGEKELIARLAPLGFEVVFFEDLSPLEQVRCASDAECMVMQHGAGMTNMIFAAPTAHVIEIGTGQTAVARWGDFIPLCHVGGCHYHAVFADMDFPDDAEPVFREHGLLPPRLDADAIDRIVDLVGEALTDGKTGAMSGFLRHGDRLMARRAYAQATRLLDHNQPLLQHDALFWAQKAKLNEHVSNRRGAANNYFKAWEMSRDDAHWARFLAVAWPKDPRRQARE